MKSDELDKLIGKRFLGWAEEETDQHYLMLVLTSGKKVVLRSDSPINVDVETEQ